MRCSHDEPTRVLGRHGHGFRRPGLGRDAASRRVRRADPASPARWSPPDGQPHFRPKAKNVIWLFMIGGTSHLESFDPKPALNRYAGKTIAETPFADALKNKLTGQRADRRAERRQRPHSPGALSASGRLSQARSVGDRGQRLVAARGLVHRRHRRHPLDVDDRQQSRRPAAIPHRPAHARRGVSHDRLVGPLRAGLAQRRLAASSW